MHVGGSSADAAPITWNGGTSSDFNTASNWNPSAAVPGVNDIAVWNSSSTANLSSTLSSPTTLSGVQVVDPSGAVSISGSTLTLGTGGINMSSAVQDLTISSNLTAGLGTQTWNVATGRTLTLNTGTFTRSAGSVIVADKTSNTGTISTSNITNSNSIAGATGILVKSSGTAAANSANGYTFGTVSGGNLVAYTTATAASVNGAWGGIASGGAGTVNYDITINGTPGQTGLGRNVNTLRYTGSGLSQQGNNTSVLLNANGILNAGTGALQLGVGGSVYGITPGTTGELLLAAANANIVVNAYIGNNVGAGTVTVMTGGSNTVTFSGSNTFTGNLNVNGMLAAGLGLGNPAAATSQGSVLGNIGTAVARSVNINSGGTVYLTSGNALGTGGSTNTLSALTLNVNAGGVFQTGLTTNAAGWWNKIGAVNLDGGTIHVGSGANTTSFQGLALIGTVTVGGTSTQPSTIDNFVNSQTTSNGVHLGQNSTANQSITFNVADVTGNAVSDLNVSAKLLNTSANLVASGLTKTGAGTMTLTGINAYTGATVINNGTLQIGNGTTDGSIATSSGITNNAALVYNLTGTQAFSNAITGTGTLTKLGAGVLTLSSASGNSYNGTTTVTGGTLLVNNTSGSGTGTGEVAVSSSASFGGSGTISGALTSAGTLLPGAASTVGTLNAAGGLAMSGGNLIVDLDGTNTAIGGVTNDLLNVTGNVTLSGIVLVTPNFSSTPAANSTYTFGQYSGTLTNGSNFAAASRAVTLDTSVAGQLNLVYTGAASASLDWASTSSTAWDVVNSLNWTNSVPATDRYYQGDLVTFGNGAGLQTSVVLSAAILPGSVTVNSDSSGNNYTFSGVGGIGGSTGLTKSGSSTLTISNANNYSGATVVNGGKLSIASPAAIGNSSVTNGLTLDNGATLVTTQTGTFVNGARVITINSGGATIQNNGTAQFFLDTANTLTGSGVLTINNAGGTLSSAGTGNFRIGAAQTGFTGSITVTGGGNLEYGNATATAANAVIDIGNNGELSIPNLTATNIGTVNINGGTNSIISFANGTAGNLPATVNLNANATVALRDWYNVGQIRSGTISGQITGNGGLTVNSGTGNGGTLTLTASNSYTGGTTLNAAILAINADAALGAAPVSPTTNLTFSANSTLLGTASAIALDANRNIVINGGVSAVFNPGAAANVLTINGSISNTTSTETSIVLPNGLGNATSGTLVLAGSNSFVSGTVISIGGGSNVGGGTLRIANSNALGTNPLTINATNGNSNWNGAVELSGGVTVGTNVTLNLAGHNQGTATADALRNVSGSNTFNGAIRIVATGGAYQLDSADASGKLTVASVENALNSGRALNLMGAGNGEITGAITTTGGVSSAVNLIKSDAGTWTLSGTSSYNGTTTVAGGKLLVNGELTGAAPASVTAIGATLGGTGVIASAVSIVAGTLSPGASIESLGTGALSMDAGTTFSWEASPSDVNIADLLAATGALTLNSVNLDLTGADLSSGDWAADTSLTLISYTGTPITSGFISYTDDTDYVFGANTWTFNYNNNVAGVNFNGQATATGTSFVTLTLVPEPTSLGLLGIGGLGLLRRRRRA